MNGFCLKQGEGLKALVAHPLLRELKEIKNKVKYMVSLWKKIETCVLLTL